MAATCSNRDGSGINIVYPCPVIGVDGYAACCNSESACLSNGLCSLVSCDGTVDRSLLFRQACTDVSWQSESCPQVCLADEDFTASLQSCPNDDRPYIGLDFDNRGDSRSTCNRGAGQVYDYYCKPLNAREVKWAWHRGSGWCNRTHDPPQRAEHPLLLW